MHGCRRGPLYYNYDKSNKAMSSDEELDGEIWGWTAFFDGVSRLLEDCARSCSSPNLPFITYIVDRLETCISSLHRLISQIEEADLQADFDCYDDIHRILSICCSLFEKWERLADEMDDSASTAVPYWAPCHLPCFRGRPPFRISKDQLIIAFI